MRRKIKLSEKELNAKVNRAYMEGYTLGYETGQRDALFRRLTPNMIRNILDLPIIKNKQR